MNTYPNGEPVTKDRIEDEPWYSDYQALMHFAMGETDAQKILADFVQDWRDIFMQDPAQEQIEQWRRWANYHAQLSMETH